MNAPHLTCPRLFLLLTTCAIGHGCICGDYGFFWTINGQVFTMDSNPISGAMVRVVLASGDDILDGSALSDEDGRFEILASTGEMVGGSCNFLYVLPVSSYAKPLPESPDEIEILVETIDGLRGEVHIPVDPNDSSATGLIALGRIELSLESDPPPP